MLKLFLRRQFGLLVVLLAAFTSQSAQAGLADLEDRPLGTMTNGTTVRSNIMFILDDSGSMTWDFLPDGAPTDDVCFGAATSNLIFYDPTRTYAPPLTAAGVPMANASFTAAWSDGYNQASSTLTDLRNNHPNTPSIAAALLNTSSSSKTAVCGARNSWNCALPSPNPSVDEVFDGTNTVVTEVKVTLVNAPNKVCKNNVSNSCALTTTTTTTTYQGVKTQFLWATRKAGAAADSCASKDYDIVRYSASLTEAQKTNYANWYSYYRTRMLAIRAGAGYAFAKIDASRFRVGFSKISQYASGGADGTGFLNIRDYDGGTQKVDFFSRLYSTSGGGNTPLRPALARAGRYFANKLTGQSDPMQYSCQRNYTILSTDGYWNQDSASPLNLLGTTGVGNPDAGASIPRPLRDASNSGAGVGETLADVAMYYYTNDLRTEALGNCTGSVAQQDVCENNVPSDERKDTNPAQHMTTFTMGLGLSGTLAYDKNYETQTRGDFFDLTQGNKNWPDPIVDTAEARIDDLWHAAVNGRGNYYSASNAADMAASLVDALTRIDAATGSSAAAATSSLTPSSGDDWLFIPTYQTKTWEGTVKAFKINTATGAVISPSTPLWDAATRIKGQSSRSIYFRSGSNLVPFTEPNLRDAGRAAAFDNLCAAGAPQLSQCATLKAGALAKVTASNVVNFLRGDGTYEFSAASDDDKVFRSRAVPMGDIVNGAPVYVKKPPQSYGDAYNAYAQEQKDRQGVLYVAANDGMLHALKVSEDATGGTELWAYVPSFAIANMPVLADTSYETKHRFFVDGAPVVADVYDGSGWRTILVGGMGKGGRGYYALDITNPTAPISLWEYSDTDLGYTYGNPVITKNKAGNWVVAFSSGYNNVSPGDGKGYLYVLNAVTGALISKTGTSAGDTGTPSNLGKINAWVTDGTLNIASRIYGADMLGNVWRFDFDDNFGPSGREAQLLGKTGSNQPITTKPVLSQIAVGAYTYAVVSVATGRYLGISDVGDKSTQSIYTFKDELTTTSLGDLRSNSGMVQQTLASDRSGLVNPIPVDWASKKGWFVDLSLSKGERVNVDFDQQLNQLIVASNIPTPSVCSPGGTSWLYYLDVGSGKPLLSYSGLTLVAGITTIVGSTGKLITLIQGVDGKNTARQGADASTPAAGVMRRTSWRELMN
nr:PilC/PilY family type IV pilus protein [uncultured Roseateles sp.]